MAKKTEFLNLELEIRSYSADEIKVEARSPDNSRGQCLFRPYPIEDIDAVTSAFEDEVRRGLTAAGSEDRAAAEETTTAFDPRKLGEELFSRLFDGDVYDIWRDNTARIHPVHDSDVNLSLRTRLIFDRQLTDLASLPWEFLYHARTDDFIGRHPATPISRCVPGSRPVRPLQVRPPLRILIVGPAPSDLGELDLPEERRRIRESLKKHRAVEIEHVEPPTFDRLIEILNDDGNFQVLHFMGHGRFDAGTQDGGLVFERSDGKSRLVYSRLLAENLKNYRSLRLVVLNSCSSGKMPRERGNDPFTGVATALTRAGLPAVLAMQFRISDRAAITFSGHFYSALATGDPVDVAAAKGRHAMYNDRPASLEWATPTLFMQVPDGDLRIEGKVPVKLGVRSFEGYDAGMEERVDKYLSFLAEFDGRRIGDESAWQRTIYPDLKRFLAREAPQDEPVHLELPVHCSIAFAAGYVLQAKGGYDLSVRQRSLGREIQFWRADEEIPAERACWNELRADPLDASGSDLVLAISITKDVMNDVYSYIRANPLKAKQILHASLREGSGPRTIQNGAHAAELAEALSRQLDAWKGQHETIHVFAAAPNGFLFFLGQLVKSLRYVQLYEYDFDSNEPGAYAPSILLSSKEPR